MSKKINFKLLSATILSLSFFFLIFLFSVTKVLADNSLVPCGTLSDADHNVTNPCGFNDLLTLINTIITFILYKLAVPLAAVMFAYAGFELVTSGGSTEKKSKAISIFTNVAIGLVLVAASFVIVKTILIVAGYDTTWTTWFGF